MTRNVLLIGRKMDVIEDIQKEWQLPDVKLFGATNMEEVRSVFGETPIDHAIMGAGISLDDRLEIVKEIFTLSETTTVHMKDQAGGVGSYLPFIQAVLNGVGDYKS